jgi:hypothetical protein
LLGVCWVFGLLLLFLGCLLGAYLWVFGAFLCFWVFLCFCGLAELFPLYTSCVLRALYAFLIKSFYLSKIKIKMIDGNLYLMLNHIRSFICP